MSLTLAIDLREVCGKPAGKGRYLRGILDGLLSASPNSEKGVRKIIGYITADSSTDPYITALQEQALAVGVQLEIIPLRQKGVFWHIAAGIHAKKHGAQVFYACLSYLSAICTLGIPVITVVHDLAVFKLPNENHSRKSQLVETLTLKPSIHRSAHIITVSESTKKDLIEYTAIAADKITVCYPAPSSSSKHVLTQEERTGTLLFVSTLQPRKGVSELLDAYAGLPEELRIRHNLVLAGGQGWGGVNYQERAAQLGITGTTHFTGYVRDEELESLYSSSYALVYPSRYEGFGMPVLEAAIHGTPSIVTDNSSLPEAAGPGSLVVPTGDTKALSEAISQLCTKTDLWRELSEASLSHASDFNWSVSAEKSLQQFIAYAQ